MNLHTLNVWAVLVAALSAFLIGGLWFSPVLFGSAWKRANGFAADPPPAHLQDYLDALRGRAAGYFEVAAQALPRAERGRNRHLLILAALGLTHLRGGAPPRGWRLLRDMLLAWRTARRAHP